MSRDGEGSSGEVHLSGEDTIEPNVFRALFTYRPRGDTTAKENFLTEALAYTLQRSKAASTTWIQLVSDGRIDPAEVHVVRTQSRFDSRSTATRGIPDLHMTGRTKQGKTFTFIVEHKWMQGSPANSSSDTRPLWMGEDCETLQWSIPSNLLTLEDSIKH